MKRRRRLPPKLINGTTHAFCLDCQKYLPGSRFTPIGKYYKNACRACVNARNRKVTSATYGSTCNEEYLNTVAEVQERSQNLRRTFRECMIEAMQNWLETPEGT